MWALSCKSFLSALEAEACGLESLAVATLLGSGLSPEVL